MWINVETYGYLSGRMYLRLTNPQKGLLILQSQRQMVTEKRGKRKGRAFTNKIKKCNVNCNHDILHCKIVGNRETSKSSVGFSCSFRLNNDITRPMLKISLVKNVF